MKHCPYCGYELSERLKGQVIQISNHRDILPYINEIRHRPQEHFIMITLDAAHVVIEKRVLFVGTLTETLVHPREVFSPALLDRAAVIILAHNHTSINLEPSRADLYLTKKLVECGELLGINILDHIIIGPNGEFSMNEKGLI